MAGAVPGEMKMSNEQAYVLSVLDSIPAMLYKPTDSEIQTIALARAIVEGLFKKAEGGAA